MLRVDEYGVRDSAGTIHLSGGEDDAYDFAADSGGQVVTRAVFQGPWCSVSRPVPQQSDEVPFDVPIVVLATTRAVNDTDAYGLVLSAVRHALAAGDPRQRAEPTWMIHAPSPTGESFPVEVRAVTTVGEALRAGAVTVVTTAGAR